LKSGIPVWIIAVKKRKDFSFFQGLADPKVQFEECTYYSLGGTIPQS
jgi:hypothetical protein